VITGAFSLIYLVGCIRAFKQLRGFKGLRKFIVLLIVLPSSLLATLVLIGTQGYQAFTKEQLIATIHITPVGQQRFSATLHYEKGGQDAFELEGDEIQVDAKIIKWKSLANLLGLHTQYELDRISGRFRDADQARRTFPSIQTLSEKSDLDLTKLRIQYESLSFLLDAEYGSASFLPANESSTYYLYVSTTGLLMRRERI